MSEIEERDEAIRRAGGAADEDWRELAWATVVELSETKREWFVDGVWLAGVPKPREARAMGAIITRALREGIIEGTGVYKPSNMPGCHRVPRQVWRSLSYGEILGP